MAADFDDAFADNRAYFCAIIQATGRIGED
jgi:hypothetical protein